MTEIVVRSTSGLAAEIVAGDDMLRADEPVEAGGSDSGPTPYEYLLAALGACTAITVRMYAERKGWPLEEVEVALSHDRIHADDCRDCDTREGMIDRITKRLTLRGPLEDAQRERLEEIAARCPVHRTLTGEITIEQELVPAGAGATPGDSGRRDH